MTTQQISTPLQVAAPLAEQADWNANHTAAQADGDLAYSLLAHAGYSAPDLADAYHFEYTATMR